MIKRPLFLILIISLLIIIFLIGFNLFKADRIVLEKIKLPGPERKNINIEKFKNVVSPETDNTYFHFKPKNTTWRAEYFNIVKEKTIPLKFTLRGDIFISFKIKKLNTETKPILLQLQKKTGANISTLSTTKILQTKQIITVNKNLILKKNDEILLKFSGDGEIVLTPPLIYKDKNNKKLIFIISIDTLRADHVSVYGYHRNIDPHITQFARDSVIFKNCFSPTSWTLPSHVSLLTGLNIYNHEVYNKQHKIPENVPLLNEFLYSNFLNVSYNGGIYVSYKYGFYRGFDDYNSTGGPDSSKKIFRKNIRTLQDIKTANHFSFLHTYQVHSPYTLHRNLPFTKSVFKEYRKNKISLRRLTGGPSFMYKPLNAQSKKKAIDYYDAEYEYFDHWFGFFIKELKKMNLYDQSMIIILSDHGEEFYEHKGWGHGYSLYNEVIHVPLIIKFPKSRYSGRIVTSNVSLIDVFPTILDFFKIEISSKMDGQSLLNFLNQKGRGNRKIISLLKFETEKNKPSRVTEKISIVYKNYKIIYNFKYSKETMEFYAKYPPPEYRQYELYDIKNDYREKNNLAYKPQYKKIFEELKKDIKKIITKIYSTRKKRRLLKPEKEELKKLKEMGYL